MISYFCNEAVLQLEDVYSLVDRTRQQLEIVTESGVELQLVIERTPMTSTTTLASAVEASISERRRSLRGFELLSATQREYPAVIGTEARLTYIDKERGPLFHHEFHCVIDRSLIAYVGSCRLAHAAACDPWMQSALHSIKLR